MEELREKMDKLEELEQMKREIECDLDVIKDELLHEILKLGYIDCLTINKTRLRRRLR